MKRGVFKTSKELLNSGGVYLLVQLFSLLSSLAVLSAIARAGQVTGAAYGMALSAQLLGASFLVGFQISWIRLTAKVGIKSAAIDITCAVMYLTCLTAGWMTFCVFGFSVIADLLGAHAETAKLASSYLTYTAIGIFFDGCAIGMMVIANRIGLLRSVGATILFMIGIRFAVSYAVIALSTAETVLVKVAAIQVLFSVLTLLASLAVLRRMQKIDLKIKKVALAELPVFSKTSLVVGLEALVITSGFMVVSILSASAGAGAAAVTASAIALLRLVILPSKSFGTAAAMLVSKQPYRLDELSIAGISTLWLAILPLAAGLFLFPNFILPNTWAAANLAPTVLLLISVQMCLEPISSFTSTLLKGLGYETRFLWATAVGIWIMGIGVGGSLVLKMGYDISALWAALLCGRLLLCAVTFMTYLRARSKLNRPDAEEQTAG